jgi:phosphomethylpyrimidine synthase
VRDYAREHGVDAMTAIDEGMAEKAAEFRDHGNRIKQKV